MMPLFQHRPLAALCVLFLFGIFVSVITDGAATLFVGALSVFLLLLFLLLARRKHPRFSSRKCLFLSFCATVLFFSQLFSYLAYIRPLAQMPFNEGEVSAVGRVETVTFSQSYATECYLSLSEIEGEHASGRVLLHIEEGSALSCGEQISFTAVFYPLTEEESIYLRKDGCVARAEATGTLTSLAYKKKATDRIATALVDLRVSLSSRLTDNIEGEGGRLMAAMLLGERSLLSPGTARDFGRLGISHILAVSGLHLQILIFLANSLLSRLGIRRKPAILILSVLLVCYTALAGFSLSVLRAGAMALFLSLSFLVRERSDSLTSLSLSATLICLFSPSSVFDIGFLFSCMATLGILTLGELKRKRPLVKRGFGARFLAHVGNAALITLSATLATLPITAFYFGEISLLALPANLLLTPLFSFYLLCAPFALLLCPIPPVGNAISLLGRWLLVPVSLLSDLPHVLLDIAYGDLLFLALGGGALFFVLLCFIKSRRTLFAAGTALLSLLILVSTTHTLLLRSHADVRYLEGEGNEYLLLTDGGEGLLYDASVGTTDTRQKALDLVRSGHLCELDGYLLSHYHVRHPSALRAFFGKIRVRELYLPVPTSQAEEEIYREIVKVAREMRVSISLYESQDEITHGEMTLRPFLAAAQDHPTLALSLKRDGRMLTYLARDEKALCASAVANSHYLIFGTHGATQNGYLPYTHFKNDLLCVIARHPNEQLHPSLLTLLKTRGVLQEPTDTIYVLPLS